jgi:hypothetical protein
MTGLQGRCPGVTSSGVERRPFDERLVCATVSPLHELGVVQTAAGVCDFQTFGILCCNARSRRRLRAPLASGIYGGGAARSGYVDKILRRSREGLRGGGGLEWRVSAPRSRGGREPHAPPGVQEIVRPLLAVAVLALFAAGCGGTDWSAEWTDRRGEEVPDSILVTYRGDEHCDWQSAVFLDVGWPLGTRHTTAADARRYVRDPEGLFPELLLAEFDGDAELPRDARFTGYRRGDAELWLSPTEADRALFVVRGDVIERWPRTRDVLGCA